jgi:protoporphyrinogen oxidase
MIVILGGGLAGMSTAYHLARVLPHEPRCILERNDVPGGLARTRRIDGFSFDDTGHYLHLRDPAIKAWVEELLPGEMVEVERKAKIHSRGVRLEFPYQANLAGLPPAVIAKNLTDLISAASQPAPDSSGRMPFGQWARRVFGDGIAEEFMLPYNQKLFLKDPDQITAEWVAWAVPRPSIEQVIRGALGLSNTGMGYNPRFLYPRSGGIGVLPAALARRVDTDLRCNQNVVSIDPTSRTVTLQSGERIRYDRMVSTLPLPKLLAILEPSDTDRPTWREIASRLEWTAVIDLELGVERAAIAGGAHWIYFPEPVYPFYRVGLPSNVSPAMAPPGCSSLSVEFAHDPRTPIPSKQTLLTKAREGLILAGILSPADRIRVAHAELLDPAYVVFRPDTTSLTQLALERLRGAGIESIGRFGAWTYSYMERALLDGKEAAARLALSHTAC